MPIGHGSITPGNNNPPLQYFPGPTPQTPGTFVPYTPVGRELPQMDINRLRDVLDLFQSRMGQFQPNIETGLQQGPQPVIGTGPVLGSDQIQQQVNAMNAGIGQQVGGQQRNLMESLQGRGFGAASPLIASLQQQAASQGLGQSVAGERDIRQNAALMNAQHVLEAQRALAGANETAFGNSQREQIERLKIANQSPFINTLLSAIVQGPMLQGLFT